MVIDVKLTPVQTRIMGQLIGGLPALKTTLHSCLNDDMTDLSTVNAHIYILRKKLRPKGYDIVCHNGRGERKSQYQLVRLLAGAVE